MAFEGNTGLQVATQYGVRDTGVSVGVEHSKDSKHQLSFELTGRGIREGFLPPLVVPKGAVFLKASVYVDEAFVGLTSMNLGEGNAAGTNGLVLLAADLAAGGRDLTAKLAGTWVAGVAQAKASRIGMTSVGTVDPTKGRASIVLEYTYKRRNDTEFKADVGTFPAYKAQPTV